MQRIPPQMTSNARALRRDATLPERMLWNALKELRPQGIRFRRQYVIGSYIADFACPSAKLIVEIDGPDHADPDARKSDRERDIWLKGQGYRVMRFGAADVLQNIEGVVGDVVAAIQVYKPSPS